MISKTKQEVEKELLRIDNSLIKYSETEHGEVTNVKMSYEDYKKLRHLALNEWLEEIDSLRQKVNDAIFPVRSFPRYYVMLKDKISEVFEEEGSNE